MRELHVAHGLVLQRLDSLERLALGAAGAEAAAADDTEGSVSGPSTGALALAGSIRKLQVSTGRSRLPAQVQQCAESGREKQA